MKILYIITQSEWGGAQRYIFDIACALKEEYEVIVAAGSLSRQGGTSQQPNLLSQCQAQGVRTHQFKYLVRSINPIQDIAAVFEIAKFIKKERPDIVHLNSSKSGIVGALAALICKKNWKLRNVYTVHGFVFLEPMSRLRKKLYLVLEKLAVKLRNATIVLSNQEKEIAVKNQIGAPATLFVISHGVNLRSENFLDRQAARFHLLNKIGPIDGNFWIGAIANLYPTKGLKYLIEAAKIINDPKLKFIIVGEGEERKNLETLLKKYELQNKFWLMGALSDAYRYLKAFDIFVLPSAKEGLPYVILEAMTAGLPIIATDVGGVSEMIETKKDGILVPPANPQALAGAILELLNNPRMRENLSQNAQQSAKEKFSFEKMITETKKVYQALLL